MAFDGDFEIEEEFLFAGTATLAGEERVATSPSKRRYDPELFRRGVTAQNEAKAYLEKMLALYVADHSELLQGLNMSLDVKARAKGTPGAYKVKLALIELILGPRGGKLTQEECRQDVQLRFPNFAIPKDWTKVLKPWELMHAKKVANGATGTDPSVVVKAGMSLRDLHAAKKVIAARSNSEARTYRAEITFTDEAIIIGGLHVKQTLNHSNGKDYATARLNVVKLEQALAAKRGK